ncbi:MAG: type II toxin-antitoxin system VapC family toxin [Pseudomonadota bacterium]
MADPAFLLDANICIYLIEGLSDAARDRMERYLPGTIVTSAICYAEVMRGVDRSDAAALRTTDAFFAICTVVPFGVDAAISYCALPFQRGKFDHLIAAHALALGVTLVTANESDFAGIAHLQVENWAR